IGFATLQYLQSNPRAMPGWLRGVNWWSVPYYYLPGAVEAQKAALLRNMNQFVEICRHRPPEELSDAVGAWERSAQDSPTLAGLWVPWMARCANLFLCSRTRLRCMIAALAAERFRIQTGRWPATWDELIAAKLLRAVPVDPFDGQP